MTHVVVSPHLYVCDIAGKVEDNSSVLKLKDRLYSNAEGSWYHKFAMILENIWWMGKKETAEPLHENQKERNDPPWGEMVFTSYSG